MPEAWGQFVLKVDKRIEDQLRDDYFSTTVIEEIFTNAEINPELYMGKKDTVAFENHLLDWDFRNELPQEKRTVIKKGYAGAEIFGSEWLGFTYILAKEGSNLEFYANLWDEYGYRLKLGKNRSGQLYGITFDEENSDELESFGSGSWDKFVPSQVQKFFNDIT